MKIIGLAIGLLYAAATCATPMAAWTGDWRLDRGASHFRGEVTRIQKLPSGYKFDFGAVSFTLADDGAFHPTVAGRETRSQELGGGRWEREHRINGRVVDRSELTISNDNRTLTIAGEHPGSLPETLIREGTGAGLAGTWRSTRLGINAADTLSITGAGGRRLRWGSPAGGNWYVGEVGGSPAINQGPTATPIATFQVTIAHHNSLRWTEYLNGQPSRYGIEKLSDDMMVLTETEWPAASSGERQVLVYARTNKPPLPTAKADAR